MFAPSPSTPYRNAMFTRVWANVDKFANKGDTKKHYMYMLVLSERLANMYTKFEPTSRENPPQILWGALPSSLTINQFQRYIRLATATWNRSEIIQFAQISGVGKIQNANSIPNQIFNRQIDKIFGNIYSFGA